MSFYSKVVSFLLVLSVTLNGYLLWPKNPLPITKHKPAQQPLTNVQQAPNSNLAKDAFTHGQFEQALNVYLELKDTFPLAAEELYSQWLQQVRNWVDENNLIPAEQFLNVFLPQFPYDVRLLHLNAQQLLKQGEMHEAIVSLYNIQPLADEPLKAKLNSQLMQLTKQQIDKLIAKQAWQKLINQTLVWLDYDNEKPRYLLALANAYYQLNDMLSAQNTLDRLPTEHIMMQEANQLQRLIDNKNAGLDLVSLQKQGAHYLVEATLNQDTNATLMLDTGASFTVLPRAIFDQLAGTPQPFGNLIVNTANGKVTAERYRIESINIGQQQLKNFDILVIDNHTRYGLLGMNFLNQFKFNINQQTDQLELTPEQ